MATSSVIQSPNSCASVVPPFQSAVIPSKPRGSVYEIVTARILEQLERGVVPWRRPWTGTGLPRNLVSMKPYRGINVFLLGGQRFASPFFLTFKQALQRGGAVKKGERGCPIVFWKYKEVAVEEPSA